MAELDKKIQKTQTDLVQSVLEAQEKKNTERVDMLVTNAIKQLKMSRFKPDQITCLSLTYLARICPKVFQQSCAIREVLKSLLRRENGPSSIKVKNDIVLQVLAANILLACCDSSEIRSIILHKLEQWLSSNQKASDIVQQILATLCMKCQGDHQTINTLIELRHHWLQYVHDNHEYYNPIPTNLCSSIRNLIRIETNSESLITYTKFLLKHDSDIDSLAAELGKFVIEKPISLGNMFKDEQTGLELARILFRVFVKQISHLKDRTNSKHSESNDNNELSTKKKPTTLVNLSNESTNITIKSEPSEAKQKESVLKKETKEENASNSSVDSDPLQKPSISSDNSDKNDVNILPPIYVKLPQFDNVISLNRIVYQASFSLLASTNDIPNDCIDEFHQLFNCWLHTEKIDNQNIQIATAFEDLALTTPYNIPDKLRQKLIHSNNSHLVELALHNASASQLVMLLQLFGISISTIETVIRKIECFKDTDNIRSEIKDTCYFEQLMDFYQEIGCSNINQIKRRLYTS